MPTLCPAPEGLPEDATHRWVALAEIGEYPMPSANRQVVKKLFTTKGTKNG